MRRSQTSSTTTTTVSVEIDASTSLLIEKEETKSRVNGSGFRVPPRKRRMYLGARR